MGGIDKDRHRPWLGYALEESLRRSLFSAKDVIAHTSPEVLVAQLPPQLISELIARALASGTFSPAQVIETAPPELMAAYLDPDLIWRCLKDVADRAGLSKKGATRAATARQWLAAVLERALESELISPADVMRFLPAPELVTDATRAVVADLIKSGLGRGSFDAALVLEHLTPTVIADHLETALVWACIADAVTRSFDLAARADERTSPMYAPPVVVAPTPASVAASAPAPVPAPGIVPARASFKPPSDKEKLFEQTVIDKTSAPIAPSAPAAQAVAPAVTPATVTGARPRPVPLSIPNSGRLELTPPPRPAAPAAPKAAAAPPAPTEWRPGDDLDILDEEVLPTPRART